MERVKTRELPGYDFSVERFGGEDIAMMWDALRDALEHAFGDAEFVDGYDLSRMLEGAYSSIDNPDVGYLIAIGKDADGGYKIVGGVLGLPMFHSRDKLRSTGIGWIFTDPDLPPRAKLEVARGLKDHTFAWLRSYGYEKVVTTIGTRAGEKAVARIFGLESQPSLHRQNRWVARIPLGTERPSLERAENFLDTEEAIARILPRKAARMANGTLEHGINGEKWTLSRPLDAAAFERLYDDTLPTLVVDLCCSFRNSELTGQAAQMLRGQGCPSMNIVFARPDTKAATLVSDGTRGAMCVTHGILVDADGNTYSGEFPRPVFSDMIETSSVPLLEQCEALGARTLTSAETFRAHEYKEDIAEVAARAGIKSPRRLKGITDLYRYPISKVVIKPRAESGGGKGVRVYSVSVAPYHKEGYAFKTPSSAVTGKGGDSDPVYWPVGANNRLLLPDPETYGRLLDSYGYDPYYEEYIENFPIQDKETGTKISWSVRYNIAAGALLGAYIRGNTLWEPTNIARGAAVYALDDLRKMVDSEDVAEALIARIMEDGEKLAAALGDTGVAGVDTVISTQMESYLIEVNLGQVGSMGSQTRLADPSSKIEPYRRLIDAVRQKIGPVPARLMPHEVIHEEAAKRNMVTLFKGLYDTDNLAAFAALTKKEVAKYPVGQHFAYWLWIKARLLTVNSKGEQIDRVSAIIDDALETTPLSFLENLDAIVRQQRHPEFFREIVFDLSGQFPEFSEILQYIDGKRWHGRPMGGGTRTSGK